MQARLGYWEKDGRAKDPEISRRKHRKWRYTRERLIRSGQLEQFKGTVDVPSRSGEGTEKRTINFIRLLATQTPESKVRSGLGDYAQLLDLYRPNLAAPRSLACHGHACNCHREHSEGCGSIAGISRLTLDTGVIPGSPITEVGLCMLAGISFDA